MAVVWALLVLGVTGTTAQAATISGSVRDATGALITTQDICVSVGQPEPPYTSADPRLAADGTYTATGLTAGAYKVYARPCSDSPNDDLPRYWPDAERYEDGGLVTVTGDQQRAGIDLRLGAGTRISGTVFAGPGSTTPVENACVDVFGPDQSRVQEVRTQPDGTYRLGYIPPAPPEGYRVLFDPGCTTNEATELVSRWAGGDERASSAAVLRPALHAGVVADAHLSTGASVSGRIALDDGTPVRDGVCLNAYREYGPDVDLGYYVRAKPDGSGGYRLSGLPTGTYDISAVDCREDPTLVGFEQTFQLTAGQAQGQDIVMQRGTTISGHVHLGVGTERPAARLCVSRFSQDGPAGPLALDPTTVTAEDGSYTFKQVDPRKRWTVQAPGRCLFDELPPLAAPVLSVQYFDHVRFLEHVTFLQPTLAAPATGVDLDLVTEEPTITQTSGPAPGQQTGPDVTFTFAVTPAEQTKLFCQVDQIPGGPCTPPLRLTGLTPGPHSLTIEPTVYEVAPVEFRFRTTWTVLGAASGPPTQTSPRPTSAPAAVKVRVGTPGAARLVAALRNGLLVPVSCASPCAARARLTLAGSAAKRLGLAKRAVSTVVASASGTAGPKAIKLRLRFTAKARKALVRQRTVKLGLSVTASTSGNPGARASRAVTLKR